MVFLKEVLDILHFKALPKIYENLHDKQLMVKIVLENCVIMCNIKVIPPSLPPSSSGEHFTAHFLPR